MKIAFLVTNPYQVFHYKSIASYLPTPTLLIEMRDRDFGVSKNFLEEHMPGCSVEWVPQLHLNKLDGRFDAIVCQTPILPNVFLKKTYVVAQQYSLAKESYQYGVWRCQAHLNLMYGPYSADKVSPFSHAVAVGNPMLDTLFRQQKPFKKQNNEAAGRATILYMPTYGELSSLPAVLPRLGSLDYDFIIKVHHAEDRAVTANLPSNCTVVHSDSDPALLLEAADYVMADFSGSAFDAIYAKCPVVLVQDTISPLRRDFSSD